MVPEYYKFLHFFVVADLVYNKDALNDTTISNSIQASEIYKYIYIFFAQVTMPNGN